MSNDSESDSELSEEKGDDEEQQSESIQSTENGSSGHDIYKEGGNKKDKNSKKSKKSKKDKSTKDKDKDKKFGQDIKEKRNSLKNSEKKLDKL